MNRIQQVAIIVASVIYVYLIKQFLDVYYMCQINEGYAKAISCILADIYIQAILVYMAFVFLFILVQKYILER